MKIKINVKPGSRQNKIEKSGEEYIVRIREKAVKGKANKELIKFLSKHFKKKVNIISGVKSRKKLIEIY